MATGRMATGASGGAAGTTGLAELSGYVETLRDRPSRRPARWSASAFAREVERVRSQLQPIRSRDSLAASFAREALFAEAGSVAAGPAHRVGSARPTAERAVGPAHRVGSARPTAERG